MKRTIFLLAVFFSCVASFAISTSKIRQHARFLSDRMAYELDLTPYQYDDVYEINYDFIYSVNRLMDDVVYGYTDAIDRYYTFLDFRNDDLRYVLNSAQYRRFMMADYFYRPIYSTGRNWTFRIYTIYSNHNFFYFDHPTGYRNYAGGHNRVHYTAGYYVNRNYGHGGDRYQPSRIMGGQDFGTHRRNDFGTNLVTRGNGSGGHGHGNGYSINFRPNNYNNANQNNRTQDPRYQDNSGNRNSPMINNRGNGQNGQQYKGRGNNQNGQQYNGQNQQYNGRGNNQSGRPNSSTRGTSTETRQSTRGTSTDARQSQPTRSNDSGSTTTPDNSGGHGHGTSTRGTR